LKQFFLSIFALLITQTALLCGASAATLDSATISRNGIATEIRFRISGDAPQYQLSTHSNELWIDLNGAVPQMPHGPFEPVGYDPIRSVRIVTPSAMSSRVVVLVNGRCDYSIAQRRR
jgi:AMIN domain